MGWGGMGDLDLLLAKKSFTNLLLQSHRLSVSNYGGGRIGVI